MVQKTRKIGLGVMGWAEMLIQLGIKYGSDESVKLASSLMEFINTTESRYRQGSQRNAGTIQLMLAVYMTATDLCAMLP